MEIKESEEGTCFTAQSSPPNSPPQTAQDTSSNAAINVTPLSGPKEELNFEKFVNWSLFTKEKEKFQHRALPSLPSSSSILRKQVEGVGYSAVHHHILRVIEEAERKQREKMSENFMGILEEMLIDVDFTLLNVFEEMNEMIASKDLTHRGNINESQLLEGEISLLENELLQGKLQYYSSLRLMLQPIPPHCALITERYQLEKEVKEMKDQIAQRSQRGEQLKGELKKAFVALRVAQKQFAKEIASHHSVLASCQSLKAQVDELQRQEEEAEGGEERAEDGEQLRDDLRFLSHQKRLLADELRSLRSSLSSLSSPSE